VAKKAKKAKTAKKPSKRVPWTKAMVAELRRYSKEKIAVKKIARTMKRTMGAIRQKGVQLGLPLGHRR
jgi:predicted nucleotidyltransferase component of viral defense system